MKFFKFARVVVGPLYRLMFRFKVTGKKNIPADGGVILCANHSSFHDVLVLAIASKRPLHFLAKRELWNNKALGKLFTLLGGIPVNRENPGMESFKQTVGILKNGRCVAMFMQGGRRKDIDLDDIKAGVALFAVKGQAQVVPVNINCTYKLFSRLRINIGKPMSFEEYWGKKVRADDLNGIAKQIIDEIAKLGQISQDI